MKKYTDKHLESVEPEFIPAFEKTLIILNGGDNCCPQTHMTGPLLDCRDVCPRILGYPGDQCPCHKFGEDKCTKMLSNLIAQWKQWAEIEE